MKFRYYRPMNAQALQDIARQVSAQHAPDDVMQTITRGLADLSDVALARLWLIRPGDRCEACALAAECPDRKRCLHLVASHGKSLDPAASPWSVLEGDYCRFPLGVRKVGRICTEREPVLLRNIATDRAWLKDPAWADREGIESFAGHPLIFRGEVLGVLAIFSREPLEESDLFALKTFSDQAAAALANARAYEEVARLKRQLEQENEYLREEVQSLHGFGDIIGTSGPLRKILEQVSVVGPTDANVLILGETGTGKELIARAIHDRSTRSSGPLIRVNCAAIPAELFESEFFGHVRGAFTGAHTDRTGRFELAHNGTLFLDEVGEIPLALQSKLLRVLQEGTFERIGDPATRHCDVRVIAATNRCLREASLAGTFRQDLYFRLSVFPIDMPPLRERKEDLPLLATHFLDQICVRYHLPPRTLKQKDLQALQAYDWPGNIRELQNVIERAAVSAGRGPLTFHLSNGEGAAAAVDPDPLAVGEVLTQAQVRDLEKANILRALRKTNGKVSGSDGAAELLEMKSTTLASKLRVLRIDPRQFRQESVS
jgi:transcriptional regulator with GAF, ATPase, and Fis domain